jgi:hypothetical protein
MWTVSMRQPCPTSALAARAREKLAAVYILVALVALLMGDWGFEVGCAMALVAGDTAMFALQRVFSFRMVEHRSKITHDFP